MLKSIFNSDKISRQGLRLLCIIFLSGCLSPIDFPTENFGNRLVVSGHVSPIADQNYVQLGRTAATDRLPLPVSGAFVQLVDDLGNVYVYQEDEFNPGIYLLNDFSGIPSVSYFVRIETEGATYESVPERMPESTGELTSTFDFQREEFTDLEGTVSQQQFIKLYVDAILPTAPGPTYVKWNVEETFLLSPTDFPDPFGNIPPACFIMQNADPQRITLFNSEDVKAEVLEKFLVASRIIDWSFLERHYFTIYQSSLTPEAYEYWRKVNVVANQVGSIFDTPPAEITGNVRNVNQPSETVLGYVQASNQIFDRMFLTPSSLPFPLLVSTCVYDNRNLQDYPTRCIDCTSVRNSSYRRPSWF